MSSRPAPDGTHTQTTKHWRCGSVHFIFVFENVLVRDRYSFWVCVLFIRYTKLLSERRERWTRASIVLHNISRAEDEQIPHRVTNSPYSGIDWAPMTTAVARGTGGKEEKRRRRRRTDKRMWREIKKKKKKKNGPEGNEPLNCPVVARLLGSSNQLHWTVSLSPSLHSSLS